MKNSLLMAILFLQVFFVQSSYADTTESLNFTNNQMPEGWQYFYHPGAPGHNVAIQNGRLEVGQVDSYGGIRKNLSLPSNVNKIEVEYNGNLADVYWGMFSSIQLYNASGGYADIMMAKHGYGVEQMRFTAGQAPWLGEGYSDGHVIWANPDYGTYHVKALFENGGVTAQFSNISTPTSISSGFWSLPNFEVNSVKAIGLFAATTTGQSAWMDDVKITYKTTSPVPEPSQYLMMLIGLVFVGYLQYRRKVLWKVSLNS